MSRHGCAGCSQVRNCWIHWGHQCRERGGKRIPRFKKAPRLPRIVQEPPPAPPDAVASIYWINGEAVHYTAAELNMKKAQE